MPDPTKHRSSRLLGIGIHEKTRLLGGLRIHEKTRLLGLKICEKTRLEPAHTAFDGPVPRTVLLITTHLLDLLLHLPKLAQHGLVLITSLRHGGET